MHYLIGEVKYESQEDKVIFTRGRWQGWGSKKMLKVQEFQLCRPKFKRLLDTTVTRVNSVCCI